MKKKVLFRLGNFAGGTDPGKLSEPMVIMYRVPGARTIITIIIITVIITTIIHLTISAIRTTTKTRITHLYPTGILQQKSTVGWPGKSTITISAISTTPIST